MLIAHANVAYALYGTGSSTGGTGEVNLLPTCSFQKRTFRISWIVFNQLTKSSDRLTKRIEIYCATEQVQPTGFPVV